MKTTTKTTIEISSEELAKIIRDHFGAKSTDSVSIRFGTVGDDRFGDAPMGCTGASIVMEVDSKKLMHAVRGTQYDCN